MLKRVFYVILFIFSWSGIYAQDVKVTKFEELQKRIQASSDTVYLVNFWATWCVPCVKELPYFERLAKKYKDQPLKVILYSLDFKSKIQKYVLPFLRKYSIELEVVVNEYNNEKFINLVDKNWSGAIPATLVVNTKKGIRKFYEQELTEKELEQVYISSR